MSAQGIRLTLCALWFTAVCCAVVAASRGWLGAWSALFVSLAASFGAVAASDSIERPR